MTAPNGSQPGMTEDERLWFSELRQDMGPEFWRDLGAMCSRAWEGAARGTDA